MRSSFLKRSVLNLWRKPFRTLLVVIFLGLVVGLFTVMGTVNRLAARQFAELEGRLQTAIDIRPLGSLGLGGRRSRPLPFELERELGASSPDVRVAPYLIYRELDVDTAQFYVGVRPGSPLLAVGDAEPLNNRIIAGRLFAPQDQNQRVAIIGSDLARRHGIDPRALGRATNLQIRGEEWGVIGVFDGKNGFTNLQAFLPFEAMRREFSATGLSRVVLHAASTRQAWALAEELRNKLGDQADVVTNRPAVQQAQAFLAGVSGAAGFGATVFFVAGVLVIMGAMVLVFRDQQREVGIEKALGASNAMIARRFLVESLLLSTFGSLLGAGVAWIGLSVYARSWTSIKFGLVETPLSPLTIGVIVLACLAIGALGSLYPVVRSRNIDPIAILREE